TPTGATRPGESATACMPRCSIRRWPSMPACATSRASSPGRAPTPCASSRPPSGRAPNTGTRCSASAPRSAGRWCSPSSPAGPSAGDILEPRFSEAFRLMTAAHLPALVLLLAPVVLAAQATPPCAQHARDCPAPPVVKPGPAGAPVTPPADAVVLFDGKDLSHWKSGSGPAKWKVQNGYMEEAPGRGAIETAEGFGDVQLHVEWMAPNPPKGSDQDRGNSGVFLMGRYEVQVLDSYGNVTY